MANGKAAVEAGPVYDRRGGWVVVYLYAPRGTGPDVHGPFETCTEAEDWALSRQNEGWPGDLYVTRLGAMNHAIKLSK
jgi:hypothetical protein